MRVSTRRRFAAIGAVLALAVATSAQWTFVNLHPTGATESKAWGVSGGQQVGYALMGGHYRASLWSGTAGTWVDLTPAGSQDGWAYGISGASQTGVADNGASFWSGSAESWHDLNPVGAVESWAWGTSGGTQVGWARVGGVQRASLWSGTSGSWVSLHPSEAANSVAYGTSGAQQVGHVTIAGITRASQWGGSAASRVDLHPAGATESYAWGVSGGQQVGYAKVGGVERASLWSGSAGSWMDLTPTGATSSRAFAVAGPYQVGYVVRGGSSHASLWRGNSASCVDLHNFLPASFTESGANSITEDGGYIYVVGYGFNNSTLRAEALMWRAPRLTTLGIRSASPATGVPITVWTSDVNGRTNGTTSFDRIYNLGTTASVTAPLNVGAQWFDHWEKDSVSVPGGQRTLSVLIDSPHTIRAVFLTGYDVAITSTNPGSGVPISVWQADKLGRRDGTTSFTRTYTQGTVASFTAPRVVGSNYFMRWDLNGSPWLASPTVSLTVWTARTLNAVYGNGMVLTVQSTQSAVPIQVWTVDKQGLASGNTIFTRIYAPSTSVAMTAPATAGGKAFARWEKDGVAVPGTSRTTTVTMDAAHSMNAVYAP